MRKDPTFKPPPQKPLLKLDQYPFRNKSLEDIKGENWKIVPGFDNYILLSDYGRVKSLERPTLISKGRWRIKPEKILSPAMEKTILKDGKECYIITISIGYEKKFTSLVIGRMMYYLFVKEFDLGDKTLMVVYKDGDATHLRPENLMLSTKGDEIIRSYMNGRRNRNAFDTIPQKVVQLNERNEKIKIFPSINQAAIHLELDSKYIWDILKGNLPNKYNLHYDS